MIGLAWEIDDSKPLPSLKLTAGCAESAGYQFLLPRPDVVQH